MLGWTQSIDTGACNRKTGYNSDRLILAQVAHFAARTGKCQGRRLLWVVEDDDEWILNTSRIAPELSNFFCQCK